MKICSIKRNMDYFSFKNNTGKKSPILICDIFNSKRKLCLFLVSWASDLLFGDGPWKPVADPILLCCRAAITGDVCISADQ